MEYIEVTLKIEPFSDDFADIVVAEIEELGFESYVTEEPYLKAYIPQDKFSEPNLKTILSAFISGEFAVTYSLNLIREQNWNAVWEASFEPVVIEKLCTIKASFHKGLPRTKYTIVIDPKMAFGTGHHQTTSLMIEALLRENGELPPINLGESPATRKSRQANLLSSKQILDMGCGTGILSILAAKMKAKAQVHAIDIDHIAVQSAKDNAHRNRVGDKIHTLCGDASLIQARKYDIILANINRNILMEDMSTYSRGLLPGGLLFISGFYQQDIEMLVAEAARQGFNYCGQLTKENWAAVKLQKNLEK